MSERKRTTSRGMRAMNAASTSASTSTSTASDRRVSAETRARVAALYASASLTSARPAVRSPAPKRRGESG